MPCGVVNQPLGCGARMMPKQLTRLCIESVCVIGAGDEHDTRYHDRSYFEPGDVSGMEYPLCRQMTYVPPCYLRQAAVALPRIITIVGNPIVFQLLLQ